MKAIEQYFHVVLFNMPYKLVLTFKSVEEIPVCDNSDEICRTVKNLTKTIEELVSTRHSHLELIDIHAKRWKLNS